MGLFDDWCKTEQKKEKGKHYWTLIERPGARAKLQSTLATTIRSHYDRLDRIAADVDRLGYAEAAEILAQSLPRTDKARSGDLGEILATELAEERTGFRIPVRRLRYKDGREMALRGDDFIGAGYDSQEDVWLLKGESKSRKKLGKTAISQARSALHRHAGRCTPDSLLFVANRLLESDDEDDIELGRAIRDGIGTKTISARRVDHMLFTLSGNTPPSALEADFEAADADRTQYVVNLHIPDHADFIASMFKEAGTLGDD